MKVNKTTGQLGANYNKVNKVSPCALCNFDSLVNRKFDNLSTETMKYMPKMYTIYLKLYKLYIPVKIDNKRKAMLEYKEEYLNSKSIKLSNSKVEYLVKTSYTLKAPLKMSNKENIENLNIYYKQYLYELYYLDQNLKLYLIKNKKLIQLIQSNNINVPLLIENLKRAGRMGHMYDRKEFTEKGIQHIKNTFMSKKSKFVDNLIEKLYLNKILNQGADNNQSESICKCNLSNYNVKAATS